MNHNGDFDIQSIEKISMLPFPDVIKNKNYRNFPGIPVVKAPCFQCRGESSLPGQGVRIPHVVGVAKKKCTGLSIGCLGGNQAW